MAIIKLQSETDILERQYYEFDPNPIEQLGEGGMGIVYKGKLKHTDTGKFEYVAIKVLYDDLPSEVVKRAFKEASIVILHDNVILMRGVITTKDSNGISIHHIISEYLDGETLDKLLERVGRLSKVEALNVIKNVLSGLSALHSRGLVHRDIDPSNIMICRDGRIKIIDFGIVKDLSADEPMQIHHTRRAPTVHGEFIGKRRYAPWEQQEGLQYLVKQTADIYSSGIVLYELLVGEVPFTGTDEEIKLAHKVKPIPMDPIHDKDLRRIIRKATAKEIKDRYQSVYEFIVDIEKILNGSPSRVVDYRSIVKWLYAAGAAVVVIAAIFFAVVLGRHPVKDETATPDRYKEALSQASTELSLVRYPEALEAYQKAYAIRKEDSIAKKIESLTFLSQGMDAYNRSDYEKANLLLSKVESAGSPEASCYLGEMYYEGLGVPKDFKKGFALVNQAFEMGYQPAGYRLGLVYQNGIGGIGIDGNQAKRYFDSSGQAIEKLAESGKPEWLSMKGDMYMYGNGVAKSESIAMESYRKAAEQNYPPALYKLYVVMNNNRSPQAMDYLSGAAKQGYIQAQSLLGRLLLEGRDKQGYGWIRQAAAKNYSYALAEMGILYFDAQRLPANRQIQDIIGIKGDDSLSKNYLQKALQYDSENYLANYGFGLYYYTETNLNEATKYFKVAQKQISDLQKTSYREDELKYPNVEKIKDFIDYVIK